jgi:hypothetical protein
MTMMEELGRVYEAALAGGAVLSGFIGTFLSFRIAREANYYSQPVFDCKQQKWKSAEINLSHFPPSLLLIILSWVGSTLFGLLCPLWALARRSPSPSPALIFAGILSSIILVAAYFLVEMVHYRMFRFKWGSEWGLVMCFLLLSILLGFFAYCAVKSS